MTWHISRGVIYGRMLVHLSSCFWVLKMGSKAFQRGQMEGICVVAGGRWLESVQHAGSRCVTTLMRVAGWLSA